MAVDLPDERGTELDEIPVRGDVISDNLLDVVC